MSNSPFVTCLAAMSSMQRMKEATDAHRMRIAKAAAADAQRSKLEAADAEAHRMRIAKAATADAMRSMMEAADAQAKAKAAHARRMEELMAGTQNETETAQCTASASAPAQHRTEPADAQRSLAAAAARGSAKRPRGKTAAAAARRQRRVRQTPRTASQERVERKTSAAVQRRRRLMEPYWLNIKMDLATLDKMQDRLIELIQQQARARGRHLQRRRRCHVGLSCRLFRRRRCGRTA
jgi:hypothetical protein